MSLVRPRQWQLYYDNSTQRTCNMQCPHGRSCSRLCPSCCIIRGNILMPVRWRHLRAHWPWRQKAPECQWWQMDPWHDPGRSKVLCNHQNGGHWSALYQGALWQGQSTYNIKNIACCTAILRQDSCCESFLACCSHYKVYLLEMIMVAANNMLQGTVHTRQKRLMTSDWQ